MRNLIKMSMFFSLAIFMFSCDNDDDNNDPVDPVVPTLEIPETYEFTRNGESTVSFSGQVTRLSQSDELYSALNDPSDFETLDAMFNGVDGSSAGFSNEDLNGTSKIIGSKTSASTLQGSAVDRQAFNNMIVEYTTDVVPNFDSPAEA